MIANIREGEADRGDIQYPHEVKKLKDVFPKTLPGLRLEREVEFTTDLLPGAALIAIPSYRMSPVELVELKTQLDAFLELNFIKRSVFSWGEPVLFVKKMDPCDCASTIEN